MALAALERDRSAVVSLCMEWTRGAVGPFSWP